MSPSAGPVVRRPRSPCRRSDRTTRPASASTVSASNVGPKARRTVAWRATDLPHAGPHTHVGVEHQRRRPPHPAQRGTSSTPRRESAATSRVDSSDCGSTSPTRPPRAGQPDRQGEELGSASAYGPPPNRERPPRDGGRGQLVEERWVADDRRRTVRRPSRAPSASPCTSRASRGSMSTPVTVAVGGERRRGTGRRRTPGRARCRAVKSRSTSATTASTKSRRCVPGAELLARRLRTAVGHRTSERRVASP